MGRLLDKIDGPEDLRSLSPAELVELAQELRQRVIEHVEAHGGHLGAGLGVVELTIALHRVFDLKRDRLCWDVGHGCYPHKLLTGRKERFHTLRQFGGLSGFPNRFESEFDPFTTGHAGTAISSALGLLAGDRLLGVDRKVIALVGDGGLTCGMAFEGLNHAGSLDLPLLVILNDNQLSIAVTVGALVKYLNRIRLRPSYRKAKEEVERILHAVPLVGEQMEAGFDHVMDGLRAALVPGTLFKELGFHYYGPFDGHDVGLMIELLEEVRRVDGPVLLHVVTEKGRGLRCDELTPEAIHAQKAKSKPAAKIEALSKVEPASVKKANPSWTEVFAESLIACAEADKTVVAITAAMPDGTGVDKFMERFPDRAWDVGISEQHAVTFASGLATAGMKPVAAIYSTFLQRGYDSLVHDVALQNTHVVFAVDRAGIAGNDGATHNGFLDIAYLRPVPGMVLMAPGDGGELKEMLELALDLDGPVAIRWARGSVPDPLPYLRGKRPQVVLGRGAIVEEGSDIVLVAYGSMVAECLEARRLLAEMGIDACVVNARFAQPIDEELLLELARRDVPIVTAEDHLAQGGFGAAVLECFAAKCARMPQVTVLGIPREFVEHGDRETILDRVGLRSNRIAERAARLVVGATALGPDGRAARAARAGGPIAP